MRGFRKSGINVIGDVPWGTHFCQFYHTKDDLIDVLVPYFTQGLRDNEFCIWITADPLSVEEAIEAMERSVPDFNVYLEKGQIEIIPYDQWYRIDGVFDSRRVLDGWLSKLEGALTKGYSGMRLTGNTFWIERQEWDSFAEYERVVDSVLGDYRIIALCTYCLVNCTGSDFTDVLSNHEFALIKKHGAWKLIESSEHKLTEEALRKSERQLRLISGLTSDFVFELAPAPGGLALQWISEGFKRITTHDPDEVAAGGWKKAVHPEDMPRAMAWMMSVASGVPGKCRLRYLTKNAEVRWIELCAAPGDGGEDMPGAGAAGLTGAGKDITEAMRAEEALKKSEEGLRKAQAIAMLGNWEWEIESGHVSCSDEIFDIFGLEKVKESSLEAFHAILHPEDRRPFDDALKNALENKAPFNMEYRIIRQGPAVRFIHAMGQVVRDGAGAPVLMFGTVQDITGRKKLENKLLKAQAELAHRVQERTADLAKSEERFKILVETMNDWVWEIDSNGIYTYASPRVKDLLGYEPHEVVDKTPFELMPQDEAKKIWEIFRPILEKREPFSCLENVNLHKDGSLVVLETSGAPFFGPDGTFFGYRGVDRDVTARKKMEAEKQRIQEHLLQSKKIEAIGRLAGGIAHDFNNMISVIRSLCALAIRDAKVGSVRDYVAQISDTADRASTLTRQLLIFSRKQPVKPAPLNLNAVVEGMLKMLERVIGENVALSKDLDPGIKPVLADKGNIEQMIVNLVVNARDALPEGGKIAIRTRFLEKSPSGSEAVLMSVEDGGLGMDEEVKKRLFEPFFSTKAVGKGTGLGLAVVDDIVKEHGGTIKVSSALGKGSCFEVTLPVVAMPLAGESAKKQSESQEGRGERILVIEDEKILRKSVTLVLQKNGYKVFEASSAGEAISIFEKEGGMIDLVFTDLILQDMNGIQIVEELERIRPGVAVLISSGYIDIDSQWPVIKEKGYRFLQKPYEITDLLVLVSDCVAKAD